MTQTQVKVWDWPVRLSHWGIVLALLGSYASGRWGWFGMDWHFRFGYAVLTLLVFRVIWGVVGPQNARFTHFVAGPVKAMRHLSGVLQRQPSGWLGHNPVGSWSVLLMLALMTAQALSGLFSSDDILYFGPLTGLVASATVRDMTGWHVLLQNWLLAFIAIHVLAIAFYEFYKRERLLGAMFSGKKPMPEVPVADASSRPWWAAWLVFAISVALVWALVAYGRSQSTW